MDKTLILNKIIAEYNFKNDSDFANFLGVQPQVIYNWKKRNTFNQSLLIDKLPDLNEYFLLTGIGDIRKKAEQPEQPTDNIHQLLQEKERIISEQADHIKTLKKSIIMNERVIDMISKSLEIMNEEREKKDVG